MTATELSLLHERSPFGASNDQSVTADTSVAATV
jgi:hypothetical protein